MYDFKRLIGHIKDLMVVWGCCAAIGAALIQLEVINWPPYAAASEFQTLRQLVYENTQDRLIDKLLRLRAMLENPSISESEKNWIKQEIERIQRELNNFS